MNKVKVEVEVAAEAEEKEGRERYYIPSVPATDLLTTIAV